MDRRLIHFRLNRVASSLSTKGELALVSGPSEIVADECKNGSCTKADEKSPRDHQGAKPYDLSIPAPPKAEHIVTGSSCPHQTYDHDENCEDCIDASPLALNGTLNHHMASIADRYSRPQ